jgi:8-oxo-dGTP diphosphatase
MTKRKVKRKANGARRNILTVDGVDHPAIEVGADLSDQALYGDQPAHLPDNEFTPPRSRCYDFDNDDVLADLDLHVQPDTPQRPEPPAAIAPEAQHYAVGFVMERSTTRVLLLRKLRPVFQRGLLNGVGGKVERDEHPDDAMAREWEEEIVAAQPESGWHGFATLKPNPCSVIHCYAAMTESLPIGEGILIDSGDETVIVHLSDILSRPNVLADLRWLVPLAFLDRGPMFVTADATHRVAEVAS